MREIVIMADHETLLLLQRHADAWNAHDAHALLSMMTEDCVYDAAAGPAPQGASYLGHGELAAAFEAIWTTFPDARWDNAEHFVAGNTCFSTWVFRGTRTDGVQVDVQGLDILRVRDGKICHKDTYRKAVTA